VRALLCKPKADRGTRSLSNAIAATQASFSVAAVVGCGGEKMETLFDGSRGSDRGYNKQSSSAAANLDGQPSRKSQPPGKF
jgi:hypothetical protein